MGFVKSTFISSLLLGQAYAALPPIHMKGSKFFYENGTQFYLKGVAYQQDTMAGGATLTASTNYVDPLADEASCKRDVPYLQKLGTNVIRTYAIDPTADHKACMALLDAAGIYVISDLSEPRLSINRDTPQWNVDLYNRYTAVVKELGQYSNVIGFFAGNEVTNQKNNTQASAYVKAAVRDTKAYITANSKRWMGVGYAANDDADIRGDIAHYFNCGNQTQAIDFWGYNIYEWCGQSTFEKSGYAEQHAFFQNYSVPVFFAEYGCNQGGAAARIFQETDALYSSQMTDVFSGGIVYMYFEEANDYGLVQISGSSVSPLPDYTALQKRLATATPSPVQEAKYSPANQPAACPALSTTWQANGDTLPPKPDAPLCQCMYQSLNCVPVSDLQTKDYGALFSYICANDAKACQGISGNTSTGVYGAYSMCNSTQQLGYVLDQYYQHQKSDKTACDFKSQAHVVQGASDPSCSASLAAANSQNQQIPSNNGGGNAGGSGPNNAAPSLGGLAMGAYVVMAMAMGGAMVVV